MTCQLIFLCFGIFVSEAARRKPNSNISDGKIVGGDEIDISKIPYQVSLQYRNHHSCGGSIISLNYILTAAHCVDNKDDYEFSIRVGSNFHDTGGQLYKVKRVIMHPEYDHAGSRYNEALFDLQHIVFNSEAKITFWNNKPRKTKFNNDIAILELQMSLSLGKNVKIIHLATSEPKSNEIIIVSGWGATVEGGAASNTLRMVKIPAISRQSCQRKFSRYAAVTNVMFCGGYWAGGKDSCQGDSGGPAMVGGKLAGIVSWGFGCGRKNSPGVYTSIAKLLSWIEQISGVKP